MRAIQKSRGKISPRIRNTEEIALKTNIGFVTSDLYAKYNRNRTKHEHICMRNAMETALKMNIGFVTSDLYTKYSRNRSENEHRVCNVSFICERL